MHLYFKQLGNYGRLGNCLFEIAATIGVARKNGMQPLFPANWKYRSFFNIPDKMFGDVATQSVVIEQAFHYCECKLDASKNHELRGYFQSPKYWEGYEDEIKRYLTPKGTEPGSIDAVAIHHRRGDYVGNPNYQQLGMNYYISAYDTFFRGKEIRAFSGDPNYIDLHYGGNTLKAKADTDVNDLKNMIACKYHICSNSTFSWWGAYLSNSNNVVRPKHYFDGSLLRNNTADFWPAKWKVHDDMDGIDLWDVTFIIPVMYDHKDRRENMTAVYRFIEEYFLTNKPVGEINGKPYQYAESSLASVRYEMPRFHRTKDLNDLTNRAETPYVFNYDADVVFSPWQIYSAVTRLRNGADICYPFGGSVANVPRPSLQPFIQTLDVGVFGGKQWPWLNSTYKSVGMAVGYNKESFLNAGGENEGFVSYGPEDQYRYMRFKRLGLKVERVQGTAFHMEHWRGNDSNERHPDANGNRQLFEEELKLYREWVAQTNDTDTWRPFQASTGKLCTW